ncbi:hypothetical protein Barb4_04620 [Bacteroidales bacterium Barb4]|nr:hypothetical protein Barb4_04620 [Bacteroidales bacterium Barb4]
MTIHTRTFFINYIFHVYCYFKAVYAGKGFGYGTKYFSLREIIRQLWQRKNGSR